MWIVIFEKVTDSNRSSSLDPFSHKKVAALALDATAVHVKMSECIQTLKLSLEKEYTAWSKERILRGEDFMKVEEVGPHQIQVTVPSPFCSSYDKVFRFVARELTKDDNYQFCYSRISSKEIGEVFTQLGFATEVSALNFSDVSIDDLVPVLFTQFEGDDWKSKMQDQLEKLGRKIVIWATAFANHFVRLSLYENVADDNTKSVGRNTRTMKLDNHESLNMEFIGKMFKKCPLKEFVGIFEDLGLDSDYNSLPEMNKNQESLTPVMFRLINNDILAARDLLQEMSSKKRKAEEEPADETGVKDEDIRLVMKKVKGCSRARAVNALRDRQMDTSLATFDLQWKLASVGYF